MQPDRVDGNGVPIIVAVNAKIGALERRLAHLESRLMAGQDNVGRPLSPAALGFDRTESEALRAGIRALRFHAARLRPESDPVVALDNLVAVCDRFLEGEATRDELEEHVTRCEIVLEESS